MGQLVPLPLGLVGFALMVPLPSNPSEERNSPRWRALLGFALINLALRYAFGAYPLAKTLGLSQVGLALFTVFCGAVRLVQLVSRLGAIAPVCLSLRLDRRDAKTCIQNIS
jgi:hypothetical protein